jgi:hypothetical protein
MYSVSKEYRESLGAFYATWQSFEITLDWAFGQFLKLPDEETHLLTAGMDFGRKATVFRHLVRESNHENKAEIEKHLNAAQNDSKRNIFAHSFARSDADSVIFIERSRHGSYQAKEHRFTKSEFEAHVNKFIETAKSFEKAVGLTRDAMEKFGALAIKARE